MILAGPLSKMDGQIVGFPLEPPENNYNQRLVGIPSIQLSRVEAMLSNVKDGGFGHVKVSMSSRLVVLALRLVVWLRGFACCTWSYLSGIQPHQ